jgi:hypothetical protein
MNDFLSEDVYKKVRAILGQVPENRPRAVLQAYNAFLQRWTVLRLHKSDSFYHPNLLALLLLLQYIWPEIFHHVSTNPYYFFYLHALVTGEKNACCKTSEVTEVKDLGLPLNSENTLLYPYDDLDLFKLLVTWNFDVKDISRSNAFDEEIEALYFLWSHITLDPSTMEKIMPPEIRDHAWVALNSGDPARIKLVRFYLSDAILSRDYEPSLLDSLMDLNHELDYASNGKKPILIQDADSRIFALGLISTRKETMDALKDLLVSSPSLPPGLRLRIIYALEHALERFVKEEKWCKDIISSLVNDILLNENRREEQGYRIIIRIARLVRYGEFPDNTLKKLIEFLYTNVPVVGELKRALRESWKDARWRERALELLAPKELDKMPLTDLMEVCEAGPWPKSLGQHFIKIAQQDNEATANPALELLTGFNRTSSGEQSPEDKAQIVQWMGKLLSDLLQKNPKKPLQHYWQNIVDLQQDTKAPWQRSVWQKLWNASLEKYEISIINHLKNTWRLEAREMLQAMLPGAPTHWQNSIEDALAEFAVRLGNTANQSDSKDAPSPQIDANAIII